MQQKMDDLTITGHKNRVLQEQHSVFEFFGVHVEGISFGWKFHVAACLNTYDKILELIKPEIAKHSFLLKVIVDLKILEDIKGTVQEGKAFTIYVPQEDIKDKVMPIMMSLAQVLKCSAPIPNSRVREKSFQDSPFVFYRYGEYDAGKTVVSQLRHPNLGDIYTCQDGTMWFRDYWGRKWLVGPNEEIWMDRQEESYKPPWIQDPFSQG